MTERVSNLVGGICGLLALAMLVGSFLSLERHPNRGLRPTFPHPRARAVTINVSKKRRAVVRSDPGGSRRGSIVIVLRERECPLKDSGGTSSSEEGPPEAGLPRTRTLRRW